MVAAPAMVMALCRIAPYQLRLAAGGSYKPNRFRGFVYQHAEFSADKRICLLFWQLRHPDTSASISHRKD
jgi:hypothetical protein